MLEEGEYYIFAELDWILGPMELSFVVGSYGITDANITNKT